MAQSRTLKTSFTAGEVAPELLGRPDLRAWANGARALRNVFIQPTGGVTRRPGLRHVAMLPGAARLIAFEFNTEQTYLLVLTDGLLSVYIEDGQVAQVAGALDRGDAAAARLHAERRYAAALPSGHAAAAHHPQQPHQLDRGAVVLQRRALPSLRRPVGLADAIRHQRRGHPHRLRRGLRRGACRRRASGSPASRVVITGVASATTAVADGGGDARLHRRDDGLGRGRLLRRAWLAGLPLLPPGPAGPRRLARPAEPALAVPHRGSVQLRPRHRARRPGHRIRPGLGPGECHPRRLLRPAPAGLHLGHRMDGHRRAADAGQHPAHPADPGRLDRGAHGPAGGRGWRDHLRRPQRSRHLRVHLHGPAAALPGERPRAGGAAPGPRPGRHVLRPAPPPAACGDGRWRAGDAHPLPRRAGHRLDPAGDGRRLPGAGRDRGYRLGRGRARRHAAPGTLRRCPGAGCGARPAPPP